MPGTFRGLATFHAGSAQPSAGWRYAELTAESVRDDLAGVGDETVISSSAILGATRMTTSAGTATLRLICRSLPELPEAGPVAIGLQDSSTPRPGVPARSCMARPSRASSI